MDFLGLVTIPDLVGLVSTPILGPPSGGLATLGWQVGRTSDVMMSLWCTDDTPQAHRCNISMLLDITRDTLAFLQNCRRKEMNHYATLNSLEERWDKKYTKYINVICSFACLSESALLYQKLYPSPVLQRDSSDFLFFCQVVYGGIYMTSGGYQVAIVWNGHAF